eukprot:416386-Amphidinium_carterae.1
MVNTAPRITFTLLPPAIEEARFDSSGSTIVVQFDTSTLQGAIPFDNTNDEVLDDWNDADRILQGNCSSFFDDYTMALIPDSTCVWTSDSSLTISITHDAMVFPGDIIRVRANTLYAGERGTNGVNRFSRASSAYGVVAVPTTLLLPEAAYESYEVIDICSNLTLDASLSRNFGFRGEFLFSLNHTQPELTLVSSSTLDAIFASQDLASDTLEIPAGTI